MDSRHGKARLKVDRLSILPDELIHKILSFLSTKDVIETRVLSSRWRFIWKSIPYLSFSIEDLLDHRFSNGILSRRNNRIQVSSIKIIYTWINRVAAAKVLSYAVSHNVQQLIISCVFYTDIKFPLLLLRSQALKHLILSGSINAHACTRASKWQLLALTTLQLDYVKLYDHNTVECIDLFSNCRNLINLTLNHCNVMGSDDLRICHPRLSNLTLENVDGSMLVVNVVTPQLVNLTIRDCLGEHVISAPALESLIYKGHHLLQLRGDGFPSLRKVNLCICNPYNEDFGKVIGLLQQLQGVTFLTLNSELVEFLSSSMELISCQPCSFANLRSLKICPDDVFCEVQDNMSTEVINYLLDRSSNASLTMVTREEIKAVMNTKRAKRLMSDLRKMLHQEKPNIEANIARMDRGKAQVENQSTQPGTQMQLDILGRLTQIKSYWEDPSVRIEHGKAKSCRIILKLQEIKKIVTDLPASKIVKIQPCFSRLCAEADAFMRVKEQII